MAFNFPNSPAPGEITPDGKWQFNNGRWASYAHVGPAGPTGPQGPVGPPGQTGPTGPQGVKGDDGKTWYTAAADPAVAYPTTGVNGDFYLRTSGYIYLKSAGAWVVLMNINGPQGITGATGPASTVPGPKGDKGDTGLTGPQGTAGFFAAPTVTGTTYTLALADHFYSIIFSNTGFVTITIPTNASVPLPIGFQVLLVSGGVGGLGVLTTGLTLIGAPKVNISQGNGLYLEKTAINTWIILGGLT